MSRALVLAGVAGLILVSSATLGCRRLLRRHHRSTVVVEHHHHAPAAHLHAWHYYPYAGVYWCEWHDHYWYHHEYRGWISVRVLPPHITLHHRVELSARDAMPWRRHSVHVELHRPAAPRPARVLPPPHREPPPRHTVLRESPPRRLVRSHAERHERHVERRDEQLRPGLGKRPRPELPRPNLPVPPHRRR